MQGTGAAAQVSENFSDGNITINPAWQTASPADWIVNGAAQLQSNNTTASSSFYISTVNALVGSVQWEFYVNLGFQTSSSNYVDVFLNASAATLNAAAGYYVRIGNTKDEISLYKTGSSVALIDGADGITNNSNNTLRIKVTKDAADQWVLYRDIAGGSNYTSEGTATDASYSSAGFFGFLVKQSTASFFQKHFFDDIEIKAFVPDISAPSIVSATAIAANAVDILFNEAVEQLSAADINNYLAGNTIGSPVSAIVDAGNAALVHLIFANNFSNGVNYSLTVNGVKDLQGNALLNAVSSFSFYTPLQYDVVIDEIMFDPTPVIGLPANEWIELKNTSAFSINLKDWKITDASGSSGSMPGYILKPDSFVLVCTGSAVPAMSAYGNTIGVASFPSLDNTGETLSLVAANGSMIHSVNYSIQWYQNELKKDGGWSIEMIDTKNPCSGFSNWKASENLKGGTPGAKNSVDGNNPDDTAPKLLRAYTTDPLHIVLVFDEPLAAGAITASNYTISDGLAVSAVVATAADRMLLQVTTPLQPNKIYTVTANALTDCVGNAIGNNKTARAGLSEIADSLDVVINEILFNPPSNGSDYAEVYNRSNKIIDMQQLRISDKFINGSFVPFTNESYLLFPGEFMVLTADIAFVKSAYITKNPEAFLQVALPAFNDDKDSVIISNALTGKIIDRLVYDEKWHFKLIDNREGVALERIDYNAATQLADNWHSAATTAGYGTPTYKNSQFRINDGVQGEVLLMPEIISPDNDGQDDFGTISYTFAEPGYAASITVFDASGRPVRYLQKNALCGTTGSFRWDGLGERNQQLPTGIYIVYTEVFNLKGKKKQFKIPVVLARRN